MKKKLPKQVLNLNNTVVRAVTNHTNKIAVQAFLQLFPGEKMNTDYVQQGFEYVKNYTIPIYTLRYKGTILCRRYIDDVYGLKYRFESPIFENQSQNK